jgi:hypothetical protein
LVDHLTAGIELDFCDTNTVMRGTAMTTTPGGVVVPEVSYAR